MAAMPTYFTEVAPPHSRGLITGAHGLFINIGYCTAGWIGYVCGHLVTCSLLNVVDSDSDATLLLVPSLRGVFPLQWSSSGVLAFLQDHSTVRHLFCMRKLGKKLLTARSAGKPKILGSA
jgi:hypothetical protein